MRTAAARQLYHLRRGKIDMISITGWAGIPYGNGDFIPLGALDEDLFTTQFTFFIHVAIKIAALEEKKKKKDESVFLFRMGGGLTRAAMKSLSSFHSPQAPWLGVKKVTWPSS
jgi:hypothetical protein